MAALPDDLVEEILLRIPPDEPALLVRAGLACRQWCRLVSSSVFRRRFRARHRNSHARGALCNFTAADDGASIVRFVPGRSPLTPRERRGWRAIDSRCGRVLLQGWRGRFASLTALALWNPLTDHLRELPLLQRLTWPGLNATVVCAAAAGDCDHLDCTSSFLVVLLGSDRKGMFAYLYSSIADAWSEPTYVPWQWHDGYRWRQRRVQRVGNDLYFMVMGPLTILKYDLVTRELTVTNPPPPREHNLIFLSTMEGGGLGCVMMKGFRLYMWSREAGPDDGEMAWVQSRVIDIRTLVPVGHSLTSLRVSNDRGAIYVETDCGVFAMVHIELGKVRLIQGDPGADTIVPYKSFYTPVLEVASTRVDQRELAQAHETTQQVASKGLLIHQEGSV